MPELSRPAEVGYFPIGITIADRLSVEPYPIGHQVQVLLGCVFVEESDVLVFVKAHAPGTVGGQVDKGPFREPFSGRQAQGNMKDRFGHIRFQARYFLKLPGQLLPVAETLVVPQYFGPVFKENGAGLLPG
jgi:hypothetical protein